ncbi:Acetamidase formamidase [Seminavis robusta]|uniref:Acetamidase formamidase n=1 Tax=Seminavis robusta TaxID=568900 RepID=A0A9N8DII9_9STRA|nr:Acetamidase formamidase [Seminavis robusta]|eukprot:Sro171_g075710.1 Acetamidase formamidase (968) ;mRNA; f:22014-25488
MALFAKPLNMAAFLILVYPVLASAADFKLELSAANVHWGFFSKSLAPILTIPSGSEVEVEMATHHACDDWDAMIEGDPGMEDIYFWDNMEGANEHFRGATGMGDGVHILTGPIYVEGAEPGDMLQVEILDLKPRKNPATDRTFGSNAAAWWGFQARVNMVDGSSFSAGSFTNTPGVNNEVITIYEVLEEDGQAFAVPQYQYSWPTITDPNGTVRDYIAYPGTCVPHDLHGCSHEYQPSGRVEEMGWSKSEPITYYDNVFPAKIPVNYHVGCMGLPPASHEYVDSIPPMVTGGNLDNMRIAKGATMYYPVQVEGALLSMGDAHAAQADSELDGTGVETSVTGTFKISVIKAADLTPAQQEQDFPLCETEEHFIVHGFTETDYLATFSDNPSEIYSNSAIDPAMSNAYQQTRKFLMLTYGLTEPEANTIITQGVDYAITQVVDGNWGVHAVIPKKIFEPHTGGEETPVESDVSVARQSPAADIELSSANVHWGFFSKELEPILTVQSGQEVVVEMATHHACDDWDRMIKGDAGMEDIYHWSNEKQNEFYRGATGGGDGVHVLTGPIFVDDAEPGDIIAVEIMDLQLRPNPDGKTFGSNAAAWWGYQARVPKADGSTYTAGSFTGTPDQNDEIVTIYEMLQDDDGAYAVPLYQFEWPVLTDPDGILRDYIAYPGTCVPHDPHGATDSVSSNVLDMGWVKEGDITYYDDVFRAKIPIDMHIGCMGLAPGSHSYVDSIPPLPTGGNLDNRRIGKGTTMYYPVEVLGGLLSMGDAHAAQGDSELDGTGIETSITGRFKITLIKAADFDEAQKLQDFPLGETSKEWIVHGFTHTDYLETFPDNPGDVYSTSSIDPAMKNAFTQTRKWLMAKFSLTEFESWTIITQAVNFGLTQLVDGNWGVHALIPKSIFDGVERNPFCGDDFENSGDLPVVTKGAQDNSGKDAEDGMESDAHQLLSSSLFAIFVAVLTLAQTF